MAWPVVWVEASSSLARFFRFPVLFSVNPVFPPHSGSSDGQHQYCNGPAKRNWGPDGSFVGDYRTEVRRTSVEVLSNGTQRPST
jgi:hypothetical protein